MAYFKKVVGKRIFLSPMNPDDAEIYAKWLNDLEISIYLTSAPNLYSLSKEKELLEKISREGYNFAIVDMEKEKTIGSCGLMNIDMVNRMADLGIFIGDKEYWSKGLERKP
jgi:RimJ/RimL family protein N-acetyltransferase